MRALILPLLLLITACGQEAAAPSVNDTIAQLPDGIGSDLQVFAGQGRDRLCLNGVRSQAGFVTYAPDGRNNCMARGRLQVEGGRMTFAPEGDPTCRIPVSQDGGPTKLVLGQESPACAYYCGPGASFAGKTFARMDKPDQVTDLAGDPLC